MKKLIPLATLTMGFSGLVAEVILLREFLIVFSGNEFSLGIVIANWLVLEAIGAFFVGKRGEKSSPQLETPLIITIFFCLFLLIAICVIRILKRSLGISIGESIGVLPIFYSSFIILLPVSTLHGALFTVYCRIHAAFSAENPSSISRVYVYETVGTIIGGFICTYALIPCMDTIQISVSISLLNSVVCLALLVACGKRGWLSRTLLATLIAIAFFSTYLLCSGLGNKFHQYTIRAQWKNLNVVNYQNSLYENICVIENEGQYNFFLDGVSHLVTPLPDLPFVETFVHIPALAHPQPEKLLIVSGGAGGVINEVLKHPSIKTIEYVELDPALIDLIGMFTTPLTESELNDPRVRIQAGDGRLFLKQTPEKYDLILIGIKEPSTVQTNRFFTKEFFLLAKARLTEKGIVVIGLPGSLTYMNEELKDLNSCIFHTLRSVFTHVRAIPGDGRNLFLSSDSPEVLKLDRLLFIERARQRNITTDAAIPWYIEHKLNPAWQAWFFNFIEGGNRKINSEFTPVGVFYTLSHWNTLYALPLSWLFRHLERGTVWGGAAVVIAALFFWFLFRVKKNRRFKAGIPLAVFTTGFAGMMLELMLIFAFQTICGYVFSWIGILVASFMSGAALGAMVMARMLAQRKILFRIFAACDIAIIFFSIGCPVLLWGVYDHLSNQNVFFVVHLFFAALAFLCGMLSGSQFSLANTLYGGGGKSLSRTAGLLYASDLLGGWLGGISGAVVLLPLRGLIGTGIVIAVVKLASFIIIHSSQEEA